MSDIKTHEFQVGGMSCQHCVKAVTAAVVARDAQARVQIDLPSGHVSVITTLGADAVAALIQDEGYEVWPA